MAQAKLKTGEQLVEVDGRELKLTNLDKVLYPKAGFTKGEVIDYYAKVVAERSSPTCAAARVTLRRFPEGVDDTDAAFFEKRCPKHRPKWVKTATVLAGPHAGDIDFCVCEDLPTLIWMAQLAAIELHPSLSLARRPEQPDRARLRPRPRPAGRRRRLLPGRAPPARAVRPFRPRVLPEDLGLEGPAGLRPAQRQGRLRRDQAVRPGDRPAAREADARRGRLEDGQGGPQGQGLRRLVAEPPAQDDDRRLLAARPRAPDRLDADHLGRGRAVRSTRRTPPGSSSRPARCSSASRSTATSSRRCWS